MITRWFLIGHLLGVLGLFAAVGVEVSLLGLMANATTTAELRRAIAGFRVNRWIGPAALVTLLGSGIGLIVVIWGGPPAAWVQTGFAALVAVAAIGGGVTGRLVVGIERALPAGNAPLPAELAARASQRPLRTALLSRIGILIAAAITMILRPDAWTSAGILAAGCAAGAALSFTWR